MVDTIKFSEMISGGDIANNDKVPGLLNNANVLFNNPWTFLPSGSTATRPAPSTAINYRLRFNTDDQLYEYYDAILSAWTQLQESAFTAGAFVTYTSDASLPDAQNLGALSTGILKQTVSSGIATLDVLPIPLPVSSGGSGVSNFTAYGVICGGITSTSSLQSVSGLGSVNQVLTSNGVGALPTWQNLPGITPSALTEVNDTNVTLTLGGTPATALLQAVSLTLGWTGTLSGTRGGTGVNNGSNTATYAGNLSFASSFTTSGAFPVTQTYSGATNVTFPTTGTLATTSQIPTGAALTKVDDTNVTLTLGGSPTTALINATSITVGWSGLLASTRGGTGVNNGTNTATFAGNINFANSFTTSGNFAVTQTYTGVTNVTFPTSGTLLTSAGTIANANNINITDDTTTNATMYPLWVTNNTGFLPAKVTSTKYSFNPSTGTLTTTNLNSSSIGIGVASSGTTGRLQTTGISKFGDSSAFTTVASHEFAWVSAVGSFINVYLTGNLTNVSAGGAQAAFEIQTSFNASSGSWTNADAIFLNPTFRMGANLPIGTGIRIIPNASLGTGFTQGILANFYSGAATTSGFAGTLNNFYGFYGEAVNIGTNRYGAFLNAPSSSGAAVAIALYTDNLTVGYTTVTPGTNSALISGSVSIGTSSPVANTRLTAFMNATDNFGINIQGTSSLVSSTPIALSIFPTLNAGSAGGQNIYAIQNNTTFGAPAAGAVSAIGYYGTGIVSLLGNLTTYYGIKLDAPTKTGAGVAATAYQLALTKPTFATTNYTAVFGTGVGIGTTTPVNAFDVADNMSVGFVNQVAPNNGLGVSGGVAFGTNTTSASEYFRLSPTQSASSGFGAIQYFTSYTLQPINTSDELNTIRIGGAVLSTGASSFTGLTYYAIKIFSPTKTGNGTFTEANGLKILAIASIATNQIGLAIDAPTGGTANIALKPDNISLGYTVTPPTNGIIMSGKFVIGTSTSSTNAQIIKTALSTAQYNLYASGTINGDDGVQTVGEYLNYVLSPTSNNKAIFGIINSPSVTPTGTNTISSAIGASFSLGGTIGTGTVTYAASLSAVAPTIGTTRIAFATDNLSVGGFGVTPPTSGMVVQGQSLFKTSSSTYGGSFEIGGADRISFALVGIKTATDSASQVGMILNPTFAPVSNTPNVVVFTIYAQVSPPVGVTIDVAYGANFNTGAQGGLGAVTKGINVRIQQAAFGTTAYALSVEGGLIIKTDSSATDITVTTANNYIGITSTASPRTVTLPSTVPSDGWVCTIKDESNGAATNNITVSGNGHNINVSATNVINTNSGVGRYIARNGQYWTI